MRRGKVAAWLGALALTGTMVGGEVFAPDREQDTQSCIDTLHVQVPAPKLSDRVWGWGDARYAENEARDRKISAVVDKIKDIGPNNPESVSGLVTCAKTSESSRVQEASAVALARIGTGYAKRELYSLAAGPNQDVGWYAASQLVTTDPDMAVNAIMLRIGRGYKGSFDDVLMEAGNERALGYFLRERGLQKLTDFVVRNRKQGFLRRYRNTLIPMFERVLVRGYSGGVDGINCDVSHQQIYQTAAAMHVLDRAYTKQRLLPLAETSSCGIYSLKHSLRNDAFFPQDPK